MTLRFYCPTCGIVRDSDVAPWCRHNDIALRATRMTLIPPYHPLRPTQGPQSETYATEGTQ